MAIEVAVFGSSETREGDPLYGTAVRLGALLARAGFGVISGGYGGVMEAVSRGAREGGGSATGITTAIFDTRGAGNRWLSLTFNEPDLYARTRRLIEMSSAYIILPGKAGTLAELTFLWALHRAGRLEGKPILLLGSAWDGWVEGLAKRGFLDPEQAAVTTQIATPEEAVDIIRSQVTPQ